MKLTVIALLFASATEINSCSNPGIRKELHNASEETRRVCTDRGGVPVYGVARDVADQSEFMVVTSCAFPPAALPAERK